MREPTEDGLELASASATSRGVAAPATVVEDGQPTLVAEPDAAHRARNGTVPRPAAGVASRLDLTLVGVGVGTDRRADEDPSA